MSLVLLKGSFSCHCYLLGVSVKGLDTILIVTDSI